MFSRISHRMDVVKHVISGEVVAIGLASVSSKRKVKNGELSNCIKSRVETPERGLDKWAEITPLMYLVRATQKEGKI